MNTNSNTKNVLGLPTRRMTVAGFSCLFFIVGIVFLWWYRNVGPGYYSELESIRRQLQAIPQVEILELFGHDENDFPLLRDLEHITARIKVENKGEMIFSELTKDSFRYAASLILVEVGSYRVRYRGEGDVGVYEAATGTPVRSEFGGGPIGIGQNGDFAHLFPFAIPNIQTAVARYDDILEIVGNWPETPSPPGYFKNPQGSEFYYWIISKDIDGKDDSLWMQPFSALRTITTNLTEIVQPRPEAAAAR